MTMRQLSKTFAMAMLGVVLAHRLPATLAEEPPRRAGDADQTAIEEIERQRARFGSPLAGSSFSADDRDAGAAEFAEAYRRIASQYDAAPAPMLDRGAHRALDVRERYAAALREAARLLENGAADLEDVDAYHEADELREQAARLRLQVRNKARLSTRGKTAD